LRLDNREVIKAMLVFSAVILVLVEVFVMASW